jgi:hypothetical protein
MKGKARAAAVALMIIITFALASFLLEGGEQLFGLLPYNITIKNVSTSLSSTLRKPTNDRSTGIKVGADDHDDLSELRPDGTIIFPGAREWYKYWTYASRKGKYQIIDEDTTHIHDGYVLSSVESASEAALQHITDMKSRYEGVGALADFYARGIGWIMDVSSEFALPSFIVTNPSLNMHAFYFLCDCNAETWNGFDSSSCR